MTTEGTVYDLGYTPYEGERLGRSAAMRAIFWDGVRRALGLRRKPLAKVLPWLLVGAAVIPAFILVIFTVFSSGFELEAGNPFVSHSQYFNLIGTLTLLFVALVAPALLIPDRRHGVIAIYASRPVRAIDYLAGRAAALAFLASLYMLIPHSALYFGISALNAGGMWAGMVANASEILPTLGSTVGYVVGYGALAFLVSVYAKRVATATGVFVVAMFLTAALADVIPESTDVLAYKFLAPLGLVFTPMTFRDWLFGEEISTEMPIDTVGLPRWTALVVLLAYAVIAAYLAHRRYSREL